MQRLRCDTRLIVRVETESESTLPFTPDSFHPALFRRAWLAKGKVAALAAGTQLCSPQDTFAKPQYRELFQNFAYIVISHVQC